MASSLLSAALLLGVSGGAQSQTVEPLSNGKTAVKVTGHGPTIAAARQDGVRQALQLTVEQLVVVDRAVENDEVVRDRIISTMNGYVDDLRDISVSSTDAGYDVALEVTVSKTRINNFAAFLKSGSPLRGNALLQEAIREVEQRNVRSEIVDHLFRGYPAQAVNVDLVQAKPNASDPRVINLSFRQQVDSSFLRSVVEGLKALSLASYSVNAAVLSKALPYGPSFQCSPSSLQYAASSAAGLASRPDFYQIRHITTSIAAGLAPLVRKLSQEPGGVYCILDNQNIHIFIMGPVPLGAQHLARLNDRQSFYYMRFFGLDGRSVNSNTSECVTAPAGNLRFTLSGGNLFLDARDQTRNISMPVTAADLSRTAGVKVVNSIQSPHQEKQNDNDGFLRQEFCSFFGI
ncbi:hypothetical protein [Methylorubrum extorquens]|uniref:Uncharacterized protein n=1 Tax=Methylorubrum extorquens TaxID=408 RepID=A0AAX3WCE9_METEX|nr:hypothetical protein [Methylorubrum extorquens]WHQ68631.1 hypothetical protein KEC54_20000 [Methylorubrum extorquens]